MTGYPASGPFAPGKCEAMGRRRAVRGVTLIEILVALSIASLSIALLLPTLDRARGFAREVFCAGNLRQHHASYRYYADDWKGWMPPSYMDEGARSPEASRQSRWGWWHNPEATGIYADILIRESYSDFGAWDCPAVAIEGEAGPMPEYGMSKFFDVHEPSGWPHGLLYGQGSIHGGAKSRRAPYRWSWWDMPEKGMLLADTVGADHHYPFIWQTHLGEAGPERHLNGQNVLFFGGHVRALPARRFYPGTGASGVARGTWYDPAASSGQDVPFVAWRPSVLATTRSW